MNKVYYSQRDSRWANVIYSAVPPHTETIKSAGCGITSAAMVISSLTDKTVLPPEMAEYSVEHGFRIDGVGTDWGLFPAIAKEYGLICMQSFNIDDAIKCVQEGGMVVCSTSGGTNGLFSTGGHLFCLVGAVGTELEFYDPDLYQSKYQSYGRGTKARVEGHSVFVSYSNAKPEIRTYFCFYKKGGGDPMTNEEKVKFNGLVDAVRELAEKVDKLEKPMVYNYVDENMPQWARETVRKLVNRGFLVGDENGLNLSDDLLRTLVIIDRCGVFDR